MNRHNINLLILIRVLYCFSFFFFNDTATTEIYTLSLHDALPISRSRFRCTWSKSGHHDERRESPRRFRPTRSEEHTSELQSRLHLVCRLLLEKKKKKSGLSTKRQKIYH